jgi:5-formyltetrahydrofolate cyclo-ligase
MSDEALRRRAKQMMRGRFRSRRAGLPSTAVAQRSAALCERLLANKSIAAAKTIALFWPIARNNEVDLRTADAALRERGTAIAYPRIGEDGSMSFRLVAIPGEMVEHPLGFLEPPEDAPRTETLDVIVVPGLAFDPRGHRIGYGGGYYDRALPQHCPPAIAIGVAFDFQLAPDVPNTKGDVTVDLVITDARTMIED